MAHGVVERLRRRIETRQMRPEDPRMTNVYLNWNGERLNATKVYARIRADLYLYDHADEANRDWLAGRLEEIDAAFQERFGDPPKKRGK